MKFDRFQPPASSDEIALCQGCDGKFHYEDLDDNGFCLTCSEMAQLRAELQKQLNNENDL